MNWGADMASRVSNTVLEEWISIEGQLDLNYVPFKDLVNPTTLKTEVRFIRTGSDYHKLARFLETRTDKIVEWAPGRREER